MLVCFYLSKMTVTSLFLTVVCLFSGLLYRNNLNMVSAQGRVVGGSNAPTNAAPFIVSLQIAGVHYCGGSILTTNSVITAAHCLGSRAQVMSSNLVAGTNDIQDPASTMQKLSISHYVVNDLYTGGTAPYDIGLIYSKTLFVWTPAVQPIGLPVSGSTPSGTATLFGWGSTSKTETASYPNKLQMAKVPIISQNSCEKALGRKGIDVHDTNFCAGPLTGGVSICNADSGGPLIQQTSNGVNILIGIVSWGKTPCGKANSPSVFVNVGDMEKWIKSND